MGRSKHPFGPAGRPHLPGLGGDGGPAQGVAGASRRAYGGAPSAKNRAPWPGGDGESSAGGGQSTLSNTRGSIIFLKTGHTGPGGTGSPAQGVVGVPFRACGGAASFWNRAHRPGGDGEPSPGGGRGIFPSLRGVITFHEPGTPAWGDGEPSPGGGRRILGAYGEASPSKSQVHRPGGGDGGPAQGAVGASFKPYGEPSPSENRAHRPGGDGVRPRGWSEYPAGPSGRRHLLITGHTGPGGTGSPAQGVVGASFGGGRCALRGRWGGNRLVGVGPPAWGAGSPAQGRAVTGGRHQGGAYPAVRARQLGGPWTAPCRWPLLCTLRATRSRCGVGPPHQQGPRLGFPAERPY